MDKKVGELSVGLKLDGYEVLKTQLNDIEAQLDRIIKKMEKASCLPSFRKMEG